MRFSLAGAPVGFLAGFALLAVSSLVHADRPISFNRDIRPILSENCFECHGPHVKDRRGDLRLDADVDLADDRGGYRIIARGKPADSELIARILAKQPSKRMPPPKTKKHLKPAEIELLRRWIAEGAKFEKHWAFIPPSRPELPPAPNPRTHKIRNAVDHFVQARLAMHGLTPSPEADRATLIRRATLALTGLPPTPAEIDAFLADKSDRAFEHVIDRLLKSPRYGERMAWFWLDAARYADTDGYQNDAGRTMWPWRDWVIKAFNDNMPFDQFTIEQLAGDMLPNATSMQVLASAFNRNHRLNSEGGALPEEFIVEYVIDRVETTSTVWLGLTVGCARCHDHKYDPVSQQEFYQLYAYFNNVPERGTGKGTTAAPIRKFASPLAELPEEFNKKLAARRQELKQAEATLPDRQKAWEKGPAQKLLARTSDWLPAKVVSAKATSGGTLAAESDGSYRNAGANVASAEYILEIDAGGTSITGIRLDALPDARFTAPVRFARSSNGNFVLTSVEMTQQLGDRSPSPVEVREARASFEQTGYPIAAVLDNNPKTGWAVYSHPNVASNESKPATAIFLFKKPIEAKSRITLRLKHQSQFRDHNIGRFRVFVSDQPNPGFSAAAQLSAELLDALKLDRSKRSEKQGQLIRNYYASIDGTLVRLRSEIAALEEAAQKRNPQVAVMVMQENAGQTPTYLLKRGQYNQPDKSKELQRGLPESIAAKARQMPANRLELARWLVSRDNPLTARVLVNRLWQQHFGIGLVKTAEDFGSQGEWPSHPDLLDWLAVELIESGWDVQHIHRLILGSATYRQESRVTPELMKLDPANRLLARGPRFRLDGATIRDQALFVSGLFNGTLGGAPVRPYQPDGLWSTVGSSASRRYTPSTGADLYRRSLYTFWRRTVAPPQLSIFDAAGREVCNVRARVTNTPLQSLVLMNDPTFVEAARALARRMMTEGGKNIDDQLAWGFRTVTGRQADSTDLEVLRNSHAFYLKHYTSHPEEAAKFLAVGASKRDESLDRTQHAAFASVAHVLLNLDATITLE